MFLICAEMLYKYKLSFAFCVLSDTEKNKDSTNDKQEYKKNSLEIKQLEKEVGEMQIKLQRRQLVITFKD